MEQKNNSAACLAYRKAIGTYVIFALVPFLYFPPFADYTILIILV